MKRFIPSPTAITKCGRHLRLAVFDLKRAFEHEIFPQFKDEYQPKNHLMALIERNGRIDNLDWTQKLLLDKSGRERMAKSCGEAIKRRCESERNATGVADVLIWLESQSNFYKEAIKFRLEPLKKAYQCATILDADWENVVLIYLNELAARPEGVGVIGFVDFFERAVFGAVIFTADCLLAYGAYLSGSAANSAKTAKGELDEMHEKAQQFLDSLSPMTFWGIGSRQMTLFASDLKKSVEKFCSLMGDNEWKEFCSVSTRNDATLSGRILCQQLCEAYFGLGKEPTKQSIYRLCGLDIVDPYIEEDTVKRVIKLAKARHRKLTEVEWAVAGRQDVDILGRKNIK